MNLSVSVPIRMQAPNFRSDLAARRARLEQQVALREEAVIERFRRLKAELDMRLRAETLLRRQAVPLSLLSLGVGFFLGRAISRPLTSRHTPTATSVTPTKTRSLLRSLLDTALQSVQSLALSYAADWLTRQVQAWLQQPPIPSSKSPRNAKPTENVAK